MRLIFTCGGTAGHINPAIATAKLILERRPESEIMFIGAEGGMECDLVPREGFKLETIKMMSFSRKLTPKALVHNAKMLHMRRRSLRPPRDLLREFRPDVVVGTGGFASYPAIAAAQSLGIPTALHESNVKPGLTTAVLAKKASVVMLGFADGAAHYPEGTHTVFTGTPVRSDVIYKRRSEAKGELGLQEDLPLVVSFWGSLGSREMNKMTARFIALETAGKGEHPFCHIHATGSFGWKWMPDLVREQGVDLTSEPLVDMREYIYNMPTVLAAADIVISRAGASTLSEIIASATPAIIVPSPNVAENHQEFNARALERAGGATVILEKDCSGDLLYSEVLRILASPETAERMSAGLREMAVLDATERIYETVRTLAEKGSLGA